MTNVSAAHHLELTIQGTLRPLKPGETSPAQYCPGSTSSAASSPLQDRAAPSLDDDSYSHDLSRLRTEVRRPLASEALKYLGSGVSPKRSPPLMGFLSLVADLVTVTPPQTLAYTREGFTEPSDARLRSPSSSSGLNQRLPEGHVAVVLAAARNRSAHSNCQT